MFTGVEGQQTRAVKNEEHQYDKNSPFSEVH
jgi:hypothetical protein